VIKECAKRLLAGEPVRSIAADLNARGVPSAGGGRWSPQSLTRMLGSARISGQREHKREIVATAEWPAILLGHRTEDTGLELPVRIGKVDPPRDRRQVVDTGVLAHVEELLQVVAFRMSSCQD